MKKRIILFAAFLILVSFACISFAVVERNSAYPRITIKFSKLTSDIALVNLSDMHVNLTDANGVSYPLVYVDVPEGNVSASFNLTTTMPLLNGNYTLTILVADVVGNKVNTTQIITVLVPYMDIWMSNPPLVVSPEKVFNLTIESAKDSYACKYATFYQTSYSAAGYYFLDTTPRNHTKENFNIDRITSGVELVDGKEAEIYTFCIDNETNRQNPKPLNVSFDTTPPSISAFAEPRIVTDRDALGRVLVKIKASSGDKVACRYSSFVFNGTQDLFMPAQHNFSNMTNFFGTAEDESNGSRYSQNPETTIDLTGFTSNFSKIYNFRINVACINRATFNLKSYGPGRVSQTVEVPVSVNLAVEVTITKITPLDYQTNGTIFLNFTTNKKAACDYNFNDTQGNLETSGGRVHSKMLQGDFPEGVYPLTIRCNAESASATQSFQIVVDKSPPTTPVVTSPNATCTRQLSASFSASDNESGVAGYNYSVIGPGINASRKFTSSDSATQTGELVNDSTYYFTAIAINGVGLSSSEGQGNSIRYDATGILCDSRPPSLFIRQNTTATGVFVTVVCIDTETECSNSSYMYSVSTDANCTGISQSLPFDLEKQIFGTLVMQQGYFCYEAADIAGNKAKGIEKIVFQSTSNCFDNAINGGETDIDCGGESTCLRCDVSKKCIANTDCLSNYCEAGICKAALCTDTIMNGFETDVDCGGISCKKCSVNQSCVFNSDCDLNYCNAQKKCDIPSCKDNATNGNETDADCGGNACQKCGLGKACKADMDCVSGSCYEGKCFQKAIRAGEEQPAAEQGNLLFKILKILFLMIGVLGIFGGSGYLYYKKHQPQKPAAQSARPTLPEFRVMEKPRGLTAAEKIRKLTVQEQMRREKDEKERKRQGIFDIFGAPGKIKPPAAKEIPKKEFKPIIMPTRKIITPARPAEKISPFERLGKTSEKKEDIFSRLARLKGETEFEKLEKVGKGKKAEDIEKIKGRKK